VAEEDARNILRRVAPLSTEAALVQGGDLVAETFIFGVAAGLVIYERVTTIPSSRSISPFSLTIPCFLWFRFFFCFFLFFCFF
jgi:hypothetical protein